MEVVALFIIKALRHLILNVLDLSNSHFVLILFRHRNLAIPFHIQVPDFNVRVKAVIAVAELLNRGLFEILLGASRARIGSWSLVQP